MFELSNIQPINVSDTQSPLNNPFYNTWGPTESTFINYNIGDPNPADIIVNIQTRDVIDNSVYQNYSQFRVRANQQYTHNVIFNNVKVPFLNLTILNPDTPLNPSNPIQLSENNTVYSYPFSITNIFAFGGGEHAFQMTFTLEGFINNDWDVIEVFTHNIILKVSQDLIQASPSSVYLHYILPPHPMSQIVWKEINIISNQQWVFDVGRFLDVDSDDPSVIIETYSATLNGLILNDFKRANGSGNKTVKIAVRESFHSEPLFINSQMFQTITVQNNGVIYQTIPVYIDKHISPVANVFPTILNFEAIQGVNNTEYKQIYFSSPILPTITHPIWLNIEYYEAVQNISFNNILNTNVLSPGYKVVPIDSSNMSPGLYEGVIEFNFDFNGTNIQRQVTVIYSVGNFIDLPHNTEYAYALDPIYHNLTTNINNTYFDVRMSVQVTNRTDFNTVNKYVDFKIKTFQNKAQYYFGKTIQRLFQKINFQNNINQYNAALVTFDITERNINTKEIIRTYQSMLQKYIPGIKTIYPNILTSQQQPRRIYPEESVFVGMFVPSKQFVYKIYKNNEEINEVSLNSVTEVINAFVLFSGSKPGDVYEVELQVAAQIKPKIKYLVFPEPIYPVYVLNWQNDYLLRESLWTGGVLTLETSLKTLNIETYDQIALFVNKIHLKEEVVLKINTGHLLKTDSERIKSLMKSEIVSIFISGQIIFLTPKNEKIIEHDTLQDVFSYELEFIFNKEFDEKNYSQLF